MSPHRLALMVGALALGTFEAAAQQGPGDLLVAPTRIVFEGRRRTAEITLVNTGSATATYRISLIRLRMDENGGTRPIETAGSPDERFADGLVRYSPRQITLEPRSTQTVRMQLRKPAELETGEYRSHLLFRAVPTEAASPQEAAEAPSGPMSIQLKAVYGVSIPVIVRHGETTMAMTLDQALLVPASGTDPQILRVRMNRSGTESSFGDFTVTFTPTGGPPRVVGVVRGVAVYTPNTVRTVGIPLHPPAGTTLAQGLLQVQYARQDKGLARIAETALAIP